MCNRALIKEGQGKFLAIATLVVALVVILSVFLFFAFVNDPSEPEEYRHRRRRRPDAIWGISMEISDDEMI